jgi:D-arabinose 1-dehydrogenase-like Zn-dependent alcohol dehydrogenase
VGAMAPVIRAAAIASPGSPVELIDLPVPVLEPGAALLRTVFSEVCGTDVHLHHGRLPGVPYPLVPGHVSVGRIEALRGPVTDVEGHAFSEGDLVTFLDVHETCGACYQCLVAKQTTRCPSRKVYGITYGAADGPLGGWAEQIWIKPGVRLIRLPEGLAPETFIGGGCGLVTALHAVDRAELRLDQSVVVLGVGPVGQSIVALARLSGAGEVVAVDREAERLAYAGRMGASAAVRLESYSHEGHEAAREGHEGAREGHEGRRAESAGDSAGASAIGAVRRLTSGADVVIEASGAPQAVSMALDMVRDGGRVVVCGHYTDNGPVEIHPHFQVNRKHVEIRGVWGCDYSHFHRAVTIAARHGDRIPWREMVSRTYPLERAGQALAAVERREVLKALIAPNRAPP